MFKRTHLTFLITALFVALSLPASAQTATAPETSKAAPKTAAQPQKKEEAGVKYLPPTRISLSRLYWRLGGLDIGSDTDVDNFMLLNKCSVYRTKYNNEFEWRKIRLTARKYLEDYKGNFSRYIKIVRPIYLDRYDINGQTFSLMSAYKMENARRFEVIAEDEEEWECRDMVEYNNIWKYPHTAELELSKGLTLNSFPLPLNKAKAYIAKIASRYDVGTPEHKMARPAYLVMNVKVFKLDTSDPRQQAIQSIGLTGVLESYEIYEDLKLTKLMYHEELRKKFVAPEESTQPITGTKTQPQPAQ